MKIGIITIIDYFNYGNRLQNYAVQEILRSIGHTTETIVSIQRSTSNNTSWFGKLRKIKFSDVRGIVRKINRRVFLILNKKKIDHLNNEKYLKFKNFTNKYIKETDYVITENDISMQINENFDFFVVGSDQVWNPHYRQGSSIDFLTFANKEKRISFSASFGVSSIMDLYKERYKSWLSEMPHISVREEAGAAIVKELTGKEVLVLVDPTLMLSKEKWLQVAETSQHKPKNNYLLTYFLGDVSEEKQDWIATLATENCLEIVRMAELEDEIHYTAGPGEFLDYINNCSIFCTDSFHGAVFSILFEKPFIVFDRISKAGSMSSRIDTLLSKFQLEERKWETIKLTRNYFNIDFSHVPPILEAERSKALAYLRNALKVEDAE